MVWADIQSILKEEKADSPEEGWVFLRRSDRSEIWRKSLPDTPVDLIKVSAGSYTTNCCYIEVGP